METLQPRKKAVAITCATLILAAGIVVAAVLAHRPNNETNHQSADTARIGAATVNFPCIVHVSTNSAECHAPQTSPYNGYLYSAVNDNFLNARQAQVTQYSYCTNQTSYPGVREGTILYVVNPRTVTVATRTFSTCVFSSSQTQDRAYEARATVMNGSSSLLLQIDAPYPTEAAELQSAMQAFIKRTAFVK